MADTTATPEPEKPFDPDAPKRLEMWLALNGRRRPRLAADARETLRQLAYAEQTRLQLAAASALPLHHQPHDQHSGDYPGRDHEREFYQ